MLGNAINLRILIVCFIFLLAGFLRIWQLPQNPPSLNWDEISHGYNAYSILKTGRDEWGQKFPLTAFRAFGDYKLPLYIYSAVPFEAVLGLSTWAVRLPSALAGIGTVILTFFLVKRLFKNFKIAALSAFLLAISPWSLMISRGAFEANVALFLVTLGALLFFKGLENDAFILFSLLSFGLSFYTYNSAKIFVPPLVLALILIYWKELSKKLPIVIISLAIFILLFIPHLLLIKSPEGQARFYWTTILDQGAINKINQSRVTSTLPGILPVLVHNKAAFFASHAFSNWVSHLSPIFLFFKGGTNYQYSIPGFGVAYPVEALFVLAGLILSFIARSRAYFVILLWFILGPVGAAVTRDSPEVLRTIFMLPALSILSALGVIKTGEWLGKYNRFFVTVIVGLLLVSSMYFLFQYFGSYRKNYSFAWQYGYSQVSQFLGQNQNKYDRIVISKKYGEPHEFLLYNLKIDPQTYQNDPNLIRCPRSNWYWVDRFDSYEFVNDWEVKNLKKDQIVPAACPQEVKKLEVGKMLLVTSPKNYPEGGKVIKTVNFLDEKPAFDLVEY